MAPKFKNGEINCPKMVMHWFHKRNFDDHCEVIFNTLLLESGEASEMGWSEGCDISRISVSTGLVLQGHDRDLPERGLSLPQHLQPLSG